MAAIWPRNTMPHLQIHRANRLLGFYTNGVGVVEHAPDGVRDGSLRPGHTEMGAIGMPIKPSRYANVGMYISRLVGLYYRFGFGHEVRETRWQA
jgi:hypothetical protein